MLIQQLTWQGTKRSVSLSVFGEDTYYICLREDTEGG